MSESILPMFSSRSFIVSGLIAFIFVYGVRKCSNFHSKCSKFHSFTGG